MRAAADRPGVLYAFIVLDNPANSILDMQARGRPFLPVGRVGCIRMGIIGWPNDELPACTGELVQEAATHKHGPHTSTARCTLPLVADYFAAPAPALPLLCMQTVSFVGGKPVFARYMDSFPFPYYIVLRDTGACVYDWCSMHRSRSGPCASGVLGWMAGTTRLGASIRPIKTSPPISALPLRLAAALPRTLADLLRQWFELSSHGGS